MYDFNGEIDKIVGEEVLLRVLIKEKNEECRESIKKIVDKFGLVGTVFSFSTLLEKQCEEDDPYCNIIAKQLDSIAELTHEFKAYQLKKREGKKEQNENKISKSH